MARTRLLSALKRWARLAWRAERQRRPTREYVEQVSARWQSTRREVLRAALGTTAMAALPFTSCTSSMRHHNGTERVVIVGAGLAGLHAAYRLTYRPGHALRMHWPSAPFALGSYAAYRPGQTAFEGIEGRRVGNLHFCGEHTSVAFQGLMEGACATGAFTAQAVLNDMGLPTEHILHASGKPMVTVLRPCLVREEPTCP